MDEFRVGSTPSLDPYHDRSIPDATDRKKDKHPKRQPPEDEDVVTLHEDAENAEQQAASGYSPSDPKDE